LPNGHLQIVIAFRNSGPEFSGEECQCAKNENA